MRCRDCGEMVYTSGGCDCLRKIYQTPGYNEKHSDYLQRIQFEQLFELIKEQNKMLQEIKDKLK